MVLIIFQIIATNGLLAALECTEFVFGRCSASDPTGGAYNASPDCLAGLTGLLSREGERGERGKGKWKWKNGSSFPPYANSWIGDPLLV